MGRLLQRSGMATSIPYLFHPGNHEVQGFFSKQCTCRRLKTLREMCIVVQIERDEYLRPFQSYTARYRHDYEASYSFDPLYFSIDVGRKLLYPIRIMPCCLAIRQALTAVSSGK